MSIEPKTKIEKFTERLLMAGPNGEDPKLLTPILDSLNVPRFAGMLRQQGITVRTNGRYRFPTRYDAEMALHSLNVRRARRGDSLYGEDLLNGWN